MKINVSLTPVANLLAQINADNVGLNLTEAQVSIGVPSARTPDANLNNTTVVLTAVADQGYSGTKTLTYMRLGLDTGVNPAVTSVQVLPSDDEAGTLAKVVAALGLVASEVTGSAYTAPENENTPGSITLSANAGSLLYVGSDLVIELTVPDTDVDLDGAITTADLTGFEPAE